MGGSSGGASSRRYSHSLRSRARASSRSAEPTRQAALTAPMDTPVTPVSDDRVAPVLLRGVHPVQQGGDRSPLVGPQRPAALQHEAHLDPLALTHDLSSPIRSVGQRIEEGSDAVRDTKQIAWHVVLSYGGGTRRIIPVRELGP